MTKVGKWDGEGTFAGTHGNDGVAPTAVIRGTAIEPLGSTLSGRPPQSATMASRVLKLQLQGDERGLLRQDVLRYYVPTKHMREVGAGITSH